jgi:diadenosine tetraphosphate (Ap4A) HIT family hydrolase
MRRSPYTARACPPCKASTISRSMSQYAATVCAFTARTTRPRAASRMAATRSKRPSAVGRGACDRPKNTATELGGEGSLASPVSSVFLDVPPSAWVASNAHAFAFRDKYPVSPGHTLVVTRRIVTDWFGATDDERRAVLALVDEVKRQLDEELRPDGYNVGFNAGAAAGQTVMHLHVHVIPRFRGDMDDPRGGVRHAIPSKGNYLRSDAPLTTSRAASDLRAKGPALQEGVASTKLRP